MPSQSIQALRVALDEVTDLGKASHPSLALDAPESLRLARAVGRGQVVLLSSHFERYIYSLNEELVAFLNSQNVTGERIHDRMRLLHSAVPIDELGRTGWEARGSKLIQFVTSEGWIWTNQSSGTIQHERLLAWMKAPHPKDLVRFFKLWGADDIFSAITRTKNTRTALWLGVQALVDLRNNIAHGDYDSQATQADIRIYMRRIRDFCERVDRKISGCVARQFTVPRPW